MDDLQKPENQNPDLMWLPLATLLNPLVTRSQAVNINTGRELSTSEPRQHKQEARHVKCVKILLRGLGARGRFQKTTKKHENQRPEREAPLPEQKTLCLIRIRTSGSAVFGRPSKTRKSESGSDVAPSCHPPESLGNQEPGREHKYKPQEHTRLISNG